MLAWTAAPLALAADPPSGKPAKPAGPQKPAAPAKAAPESALNAATRALLEQLEEREMPDVTIWVLDRVAADPAASAELKAEVPFRRALALVALGRTEADSKKRAATFDQAQAMIDEFLKSSPEGRRAIDAYTQKGNLLIERGRSRLEQAKRPGADVAALRKEAVGYFEQAIKALEGKVKPGEEIKQVDNAEDAVLKEWRAARDKVATLKPKDKADDGDPKDKKPQKKPIRLDAATEKQLEALEADMEALQGKLVQTRLMVASAYYEKSKGFEPKSKEWSATLEESTKQFKELAEKYPTLGGGALALYYQGRNLADLGKWEQAAGTLAGLVAIEDRSPLGVMLRVKALTTSLECWTQMKKLDAFDLKMRDFVLDENKLLRFAPEADRLALQYRAALMLQAQAGNLPKNDPKGKVMAQQAGKLAMDVAKVNRDFGEEARKLVESLGKDVVGAAGQDFDGIVNEAKLAMATMQAKQAEAKKLQGEGKDAAAATTAAAAARDDALAKFDAALALAAAPPGKDQEPVSDQAANYARYIRTFLLYDAKRYADAADQGALLVEKFPNAMGSRQAGKIAMAAFQQLAKGPDAAAATAAKEKLLPLARSIATIWPTEPEGADALGILVNSAIESKNPQAIVEFVDSLPKAGPNRASIAGRAGTALWREVMEQGRAEEGARAAPEAVAGWKKKARAYLDEALKTPATEGPALAISAAAGLSRAQIALDDGDAATAVKILEAPKHGPWQVVGDPKADPKLRQGSFAEATLTVALRAFIQAEQLEKAQQAMDRLEKLAGSGTEDASTRLTAMYFSMGRELQEQLERLGSAGAADADARQKAGAILGGFEKFLDGLAKRDPRVPSQIWVATTYLTLGSGKGTGAIVPKTQAEKYLDRAAEVYKQLLGKKGDADVTKFEPSIRLKMAAIYRERGKWDDAQEQIDWILSDAKRQNSLETQVQAAEILQATGLALAATDTAAADAKLREATAGRKSDTIDIWGWGGIANKVGRQAFGGDDEKALKARDLFFTARLNQAACLLARSKLPGKPPDSAKDLLTKAEAAVALTRKMYPDLGGTGLQSRFENLLKDIQRAQGATSPRGFIELDEKAAAASPATAAAK